MTIALRAAGISVVLLDIEGTTTPMAFVHDVLFPFARQRLASWLDHHADGADGRRIIDALWAEHDADTARGEPVPQWPAAPDGHELVSAVAYGEWLMDRDRKSPALKEWQGLIWEEGYRAGHLCGEVYPDVAPAMRRWSSNGTIVAIYSSGSALAQRRLFASTPEGDLTSFIGGFFDTGVGAKVDAASYARIADALGRRPSEVLFLSDMTRELAAAAEAGCRVALAVRPGNLAQSNGDRYEVIESFDVIG